MTNCPQCGTPSPVYDTRDVSYTYKEHKTVIPAVSGFYCDFCGEVTLNRDAANRYMDLIGTFQHEIDSILSESAPI